VAAGGRAGVRVGARACPAAARATGGADCDDQYISLDELLAIQPAEGDVTFEGKKFRVRALRSGEVSRITAAARILGVTPDRVRQLAASGQLPPVQSTALGRLFARRTVERLARERAAQRRPQRMEVE